MRADIAIITSREDEFDAVFERLEKHESKTVKGGISRRTYATFSVPTRDNKVCTVALTRSPEQGVDVTQQVAFDMMRDLEPQLLLVVGIASGVPNNELTLGDVIVSSRIHNFNLNAIKQGVTTFDVKGGIHPHVSDITASLPMYRGLLTAWNELDNIHIKRPFLDLSWAQSNVYGDPEWRGEVLTSLKSQFGESASRLQLPIFKTGGIASSNSLIKDTEIPTTWLKDARSILAVEMESAGALQAAQQMNKQYSVMAIRGISDIIGLNHDRRWTPYACQTAGAFTYAFIKAGIIEPQESSSPTSTVSASSKSFTSTIQPKPITSQTAMSTDPTKPAPLNLFISYSEADEKFKKELETHLVMLRREDTIRPWHSKQAEVGLVTETEIDNHIDQSQIILLLISPNFLASDYLYEQEMVRAMERHVSGEARVIPIILRSADMGETPFSKLQALPRSHQPIDKASNRDEVWSKIAQEIRSICVSLRKSSAITQTEQLATTSVSKSPSRIHKVGNVFIRKGTPDITFVEFPDFKYLKQDLRPEGRSFVIEGPSGVGKTSAIKRAKDALGPSILELEYLSVHTKENRERLRTLQDWHKGTLIIDDFHWLDAKLYQEIADYLKYLADTDSTTKKLVIIGIPHCGQTLIDIAPDLATRITTYTWKPANDDMILEMIEKGEEALNISFTSKAEITRTANGSLFIAQSLCYNLCIEAGIEETQKNTTIIKCEIDDGIRRTMEELETKFRQPTLHFAALGDDYKDTTCLDLLRELADSENGMLSLRELTIRKLEIRPAVKRFIDENWMEGLKKDYPRIAKVLFYDSTGCTLVVEDPQLTFYLRRISFPQLAKAAGKIPQEAGQKLRLFICYSKSEAFLTENFLLTLTPFQNQITIESWNDSDILSDIRDPRDLEIAIKSSTFALIFASQKLLVTSGFFTEYNLLALLKTASNKSTTVLPVIAAPCLFDGSGLDQFQAFNDPDRSLMEMTDIERERVFVQLANLIRKKLQKPQISEKAE